MFNHSKKKDFGEEFQEIMKSFINKKASNHSVATKIAISLKKGNEFSSPFKPEGDYLNEINNLNISSHSSSIIEGKKSPKKIFFSNINRSETISQKKIFFSNDEGSQTIDMF